MRGPLTSHEVGGQASQILIHEREQAIEVPRVVLLPQVFQQLGDFASWGWYAAARILGLAGHGGSTYFTDVVSSRRSKRRAVK